MTVNIIEQTPLRIVEKAINTCWDTDDKCVSGVVNETKINRVVNKFKHRSTVEHSSITMALSDIDTVEDKVVYEQLKYCPYSICTNTDNNICVTINMRAILELDIPIEYKKKFVTNKYQFLLDGGE